MDFLHKILHLSCRFNFSVTSWIRSPKHNEKVGGVRNSMHLLGLAVDVILDDWSETDVFIKACKRIGLLAITEGDHIHIQIPYYNKN